MRKLSLQVGMESLNAIPTYKLKFLTFTLHSNERYDGHIDIVM